MTRPILPLCTIDEVRAELDDTNRSLLRLGEYRMFLDEDRYEVRRATLIEWQRRLTDQLDAMEAA